MARLQRVAPELPAASLQPAITFYERLGFETASRFPGLGYAIVERDGIALHLFEDKGHRATPVGIHIFTSDLTGLFEEFEDLGIRFAQKIERKPWGNRDFRLRDDYGNELKFTEPHTAEDE